MWKRQLITTYILAVIWKLFVFPFCRASLVLKIVFFDALCTEISPNPLPFGKSLFRLWLSLTRDNLSQIWGYIIENYCLVGKLWFSRHISHWYIIAQFINTNGWKEKQCGHFFMTCVTEKISNNLLLPKHIGMYKIHTQLVADRLALSYSPLQNIPSTTELETLKIRSTFSLLDREC